MIYELFFRIGLAIKRIKCVLYGCWETYGSNWNMPDDWHSPVSCKRCDACEDVYGVEDTPWELLSDSDSFWYRLSKWLAWRKR